MNIPASPPAPASDPIRLVVNADDFGLTEAVNEGIAVAHRKGIVTAASMMAVGKGFDHAVSLCRHIPSLDIGVHLTLVGAEPLLKRTSLAPAGGRFPKDVGGFLQRYLRGRIRRSDIQAEFSAQIECILSRGISVSHIDSHQHVHAFPSISEMVFRLAESYRIPFVRAPVETLRPFGAPGLRGVRRIFGSALLRASWKAARLAGNADRRRPSLRFLGFQTGGRIDSAALKRMLSSLRPGETCEIMCHPGFTPAEDDIRRWRYAHEGELKALTDPDVRAYMEGRGIELCSFARLIQ